MAFDYMHPPEDFEYLGEWCKAWRDPATGDWTISQLLDGLETEQIILSGEEVRELARLAAQHDPTDYELEYGELRRPMFASPDENGTAVNAAEGAGGEQARTRNGSNSTLTTCGSCTTIMRTCTGSSKMRFGGLKRRTNRNRPVCSPRQRHQTEAHAATVLAQRLRRTRRIERKR